MMFRRLTPYLCSVAWVVFFSQALQAQITPYSDLSLFQAEAGTLTTEDFESFSALSGAFRDRSFDFGDFTAINARNPDFDGGDILSVAGDKEIVVTLEKKGFASPAATLLLTFDNPITALGFDAYDWVEVSSVAFKNQAGSSVGSVSVQGGPANDYKFWGFISDTPFTTFEISTTSSTDDEFQMDNVRYSSHVPEPGTLTMLGMAAAGLGMLRRRR